MQKAEKVGYNIGGDLVRRAKDMRSIITSCGDATWLRTHKKTDVVWQSGVCEKLRSRKSGQ
tara:strand:+ start:334 stop:516 length:183 start_codon:yes stop_codon:yes gene_type:complete